MTNGNFAEGVAILAKYVDPEGYDVRAEHDEIWMGGDEVLSPEDDARLIGLGWRKAPEGGWSCFP